MTTYAVSTRDLRATADLIEDAVRYGLPAPQTVHASALTRPTLIMAEFPEVEQWAEYLHTTAEQYTTGEVEHITAEANVSDVYGISVKVTTNRRLDVEAVTP